MSGCNCQYWAKYFICKHVIGIAYDLSLTEFPTLDLSIEKNAKRGRRKKALPALQRNSNGPLNTNAFGSSLITTPATTSSESTMNTKCK